ncbi:MAG: redoxin domain-containing protein [Armatimonadia bacterium]
MGSAARCIALLCVVCLVPVASLRAQQAPQGNLKIGDKAPDFKLQASDGKEYELAQFAGKKAVALCWFPRAGSKGAMAQCAALESVMARLPVDKVQVFGCSTAALDVTTAFGQSGKYSFPVLSDANWAVARAYGCLRADGSSERWTFLIGPEGNLLGINRNTTPQTQGADLVTMLAAAGLVDGAATPAAAATATAPRLAPGGWFTIAFPEMPPTLFALWNKRTDPAQMTVFLPRNYDPQREHPLLILLNGSDGGNASNPTLARMLSDEQDFICVALPLFKVNLDPAGSGKPLMIVRTPDGQYSWPFYRTMLARLEQLVPNIDPNHRILGGFSNGAHATAALLDGSDGEVARLFSAFMFVEGGGGLERYDLLKGKPFLMLSSNAKSLPRATEISEAAKAAGAQTTLVFEDIGQHGFPPASYPAVKKWLRAAADLPEAGTAAAPQVVPGDQQITLQVGGQTRTCWLHLPKGYDPAKTWPLVISLHGARGNGKSMAGTTGFNPMADRYGFIAAYPDGIAGDRTWNALFGKVAGGEGILADEVDDVAFMRTLIEFLHTTYNTDPARVFVCGHSAGAYMSYRVAVELSDLVAAVGIVNGSLGIKSVDGTPCLSAIPAPVAPVSLIHVCGRQDGVVKYDGGQAPKNLYKSVLDCVRFFVEADGCATPGQDTPDAGNGVTRTLYSGGRNGTEVELVVVGNCNHNWPTPQTGLSASQALWDFFASHPKTGGAR